MFLTITRELRAESTQVWSARLPGNDDAASGESAEP